MRFLNTPKVYITAAVIELVCEYYNFILFFVGNFISTELRCFNRKRKCSCLHATICFCFFFFCRKRLGDI